MTAMRALLFAAILLWPLTGMGQGMPKQTVCHVPRGNPAAAQTLTLREPALASHLQHGDRLGACAGVAGGPGSKPGLQPREAEVEDEDESDQAEGAEGVEDARREGAGTTRVKPGNMTPNSVRPGPATKGQPPAKGSDPKGHTPATKGKVKPPRG